ncbi:BTAD domain-containing putative transcriptional regulator [Micromonospora sp. DSM 115977]|uniref:BTAD domain-containing putative transcriptional regulator n=1 Tax=Micromonospora reichwaldensis TaxID=3075516 RepID=A0ABU2WWK1_9ACTN|nr:BTAD domain-containing putative transcriptional regulator [Micromonospora sp. DSM 115977]MDT0530296.1 BTAD domain-containing putative transcriptional regulator [Micromonospora sp. DSM 115977]
MRFEVLGPVRVCTPDGEATLAPTPRALLAVLLAARGRPVTSERLLAELWPAGVPSTAMATLQMHASALRKVVGDRLRTASGGYRLDLTDATLDAAEFERTGALGLWRGDAYDGVRAGPSVAAAAARLAELRLSARLDWARRALAEGRHVTAATELAGWVAERPTAEGLVRQLMLALYRCGRAGDALTAYDDVTAALGELGARPGPELGALAAAVRRRDRTLDRPAPGVPARRNRFVGRHFELDRAIDLLGAARLLTVVGPGGAGKTRLSLELARRWPRTTTRAGRGRPARSRSPGVRAASSRSSGGPTRRAVGACRPRRGRARGRTTAGRWRPAVTIGHTFRSAIVDARLGRAPGL